MSNTARQRAWRERQREQGRGPATIWINEHEKFVIDRILKQMRKTGETPAAMRDAKGRYTHLDL